ncbi:RNA-binding protein pop5 [Halocaridina rubra]|uniref:Ribonuclease P/MRP protein subunit POP5 n=1 Tax=Halocaridina rubra TaxID=373956 RepID=A0AAN8X550_HALRR
MVRFKKRYIVLEVELPPKCKKEDRLLYFSLKNKIRQLHGEYGEAAVEKGLRVKYVNEQTNIAIISVARYAFKLVASTLPFVTKISLKTLYVGASFKHSLLFIKKHHEKTLRALRVSESSVDTQKT